ncbi:MAG: penicillin-binding protein [Candidatus Omnitrophica bacterium]|nr:penicillin-binding protein [Candidatus Omnitrophota bacterium]
MVKSKQFRKLASQQHRIFTEIEPERGVIFDRKLKPLALNTVSYSVFATNEATAEDLGKNRLGQILQLDENVINAKLNLGKNFIWLKRKIGPELSAKIKDLNITGIGQLRENKRFYPDGQLGCHVIGFTDIDNRGLEGLELYCDSYLAGIKGWRLAHRDAKRRELFCWGYKTILPTDGYNVILTIDSVIQNIVERHVRKAAQRYKVDSASAIVINPNNGEILALYNYPDYDLNNFGEYGPQVYKNLAIANIFEPGSSFKFITAAAALEENKAGPEDRFDCEKGSYPIGGRILHDYRPYGELTFREVIEHSSNIGVCKIAQLLGAETLYSYIRDFGFGDILGIDLPGEVKGIIRPPAQWSRVSISSVPMGQEVAVTPLQLITAMSAIANDGILFKPKIIRFIQHKDGQIVKSFPVQEIRRVISPENAKVLKDILSGVVEQGTGKRAKLKDYSAAGKTGTAQKPNPAGGYYDRKYVSTFVGFVPVDRPRIAILVVLDDPHPQYFGGTVCAPVFRKIATETMRYLQIPQGPLEQEGE